jgi:catechol 2,3-dioxygenase-like lactoylglutathione lyase family enzyme
VSRHGPYYLVCHPSAQPGFARDRHSFAPVGSLFLLLAILAFFHGGHGPGAHALNGQGKMKDVAFIKDPDGYWIEIVEPMRLKSLGR